MLRRALSTAQKQFPSYEQTMLPSAYHAKLHAESSTSMWAKINLFLVIPVLAGVAWYALPVEFAHMKHLDEHKSEYIAWPHLRKRKNEFPWGDNALFHHPNANPGPSD